MNRRSFLAASGGLVLLPAVAKAAPTAAGKYRVGVIGHTGRGNYGHGLDTVWLKLPETQIVGVADADEAGLAVAQARLSVAQGFRDYREMLKATKPDVVAVCPRHVDQHCEMILAAIDAGARALYVEKPFVRTPAEADLVVAACEKSGAKLAVAHRNRYHPTLAAIDKLIADGRLGKLLEIRGRGKSDRRGGGEDLWVLGSHVMNLIAYFGGPPKSCSALLKQDGRAVTKADVKEGNEGLGPLAGNELAARYEMSRGPTAYFASLADDGTGGAGFGLQIVGSEGVVDIKCDVEPLAQLLPGNPLKPSREPRSWIPISSAGPGEPEPRTDLSDYVAKHVGPARDLLVAMEQGRQPLCGVHEAATTVEMICGVFESHRQNGAAVPFPLVERGNPLAKL